MKQFRVFCLMIMLLAATVRSQPQTVISSKVFTESDMKRTPEGQENLMDKVQQINLFPKARYDLYEKSGAERELYISNHDQVNPRRVGIIVENQKNLIIDGQGSEFVCHGRMIPVALINCENITLKNFSIDFEVPALRQLNVLEVDKERGEITAEIYPPGNYRVDNGKLIILGETYEIEPVSAMAFRPDKRLAYQRRDLNFNPETVTEKSPDILILKGWDQAAVTSPGERFVLRSYYRPAPGIFVSECSGVTLENVKVHYAEGMGLLVQNSENILLDGFSVCLKGGDDPRFFTTQADATHFSGCKGMIVSKNGLYEGMADDAINVHGTYLRVIRRVNDTTLIARYMHSQSWGFKWGDAGDEVQFVEPAKMEVIDNSRNRIKSIKPYDKLGVDGASEFQFVFENLVPKAVSEGGKTGIENLTRTPEVVFADNVIRNNRARGALFSTPKKVVCESNLFDHTHGTAILLCGDCNGWFETGGCTEVLIRNNRFVNALTATYQFTNAIISIFPEIPNLKEQKKYFHSGIVIEGNTFETFDRPILYAKSTDGLLFRNNSITYNTEFEPFHWNDHLFFFERVNGVIIGENHFGNGFDVKKDMKIELSPKGVVTVK